MTFFDFAKRLTGRRVSNKRTGRPFYPFELYWRTQFHDVFLEELFDWSHPDLQVTDKSGWANGRLVDLKKAGIDPSMSYLLS